MDRNSSVFARITEGITNTMSSHKYRSQSDCERLSSSFINRDRGRGNKSIVDRQGFDSNYLLTDDTNKTMAIRPISQNFDIGKLPRGNT